MATLTQELAGLGHVADGMSLRDWFAGKALPGMVAGYTTAYGSPTSTPDEIADEVYKLADSMIARRNAPAAHGPDQVGEGLK